MREFKYLKAASKNGEKRDATNSVFKAFDPAIFSGPHPPFLVWSQRTTHFLVFKSVGEYEAWVAKKPVEERCYCEVIFGNSPQRLRLDLDRGKAPSPDDLAPLKTILVAVKKIWKSNKPPAEPGWPNTGHLMLFRTGNGFHVVIDHVVGSAQVAAAFSEAVKQECGALAPMIDQAVYHQIQNFRIMGNSKPGEAPKVSLDPQPPRLIDTLIVPRR